MAEVLLVAHGSPSDPEPPDAELARIAARVADRLPGLRIRSATLAKPGSLETALSGLEAPQVYPFLMAEGWFTRSELPRRLAQAGSPASVLPPFGLEPELPELVRRILASALGREVILVAHGSRRPGLAKAAALSMVEGLRRSGLFRAVVPAFLEEAPFLVDVARAHPGAVCLPFFALRAGHVAFDIPEALEEAGFYGDLLPAVGEDAAVPELIAGSLRHLLG